MGELASPLSGPASFVVSGGSNAFTEAQNSNNFYVSAFRAFGSGFTALRDLHTGLIPSAAISFAPSELTISGTTPPGDMAETCIYPGELSLSRARVSTGTTAGRGFAGFFRGIAIDPSLALFNWKTAMSALGLPRADSSIGNFVGEPGKAVAVFSGRAVNAFFATDNPDFW